MTTFEEFLEFKKDKAFMEKLMRECDEEMEQEFEGQLERLKETRKQKAPVLFVGSGISRRYLDSPDWEGLLKGILKDGILKDSETKYEELKKAANGDFEKIAQEIEFYCFRGCTDQELKAAGSRRAVLRRRIADVIKPAGGTLEAKLKTSGYRDEIGALQRIRPAAIITTNYDTFLENMFSGYKPIIGQTDIFRREPSGQKYIYKIHGSVTNAESILITKEDYDAFFEKSKYLYAKILTTFLEYPLIFMGYSIRDRNILHILTAIWEMLTEEEAETFAKRIWILDWQKYTKTGHVEECKIELLNGKSIRVTRFVMGDFTRFFNALKAPNGGHDKPLKFSISEDVMKLLIEPLYNSQDKLQVAVRELLQNALDACKLANWEAAKITVRYEEEGEDAFLSVEDNGIGMDETDIREKYLTVGKSGKEGQDNLTGKYGIGALSMFLIGKSTEILTKKGKEDELAFKLYLKGEKEQAKWITWKSSRPASGSYTVIRIRLEEKIEAEKYVVSMGYQNVTEEEKKARVRAAFIRRIGLDTYVVSGSQEITVSYKGEEARIKSIADLDCFEPIEGTDGRFKLLDENRMWETLHWNVPAEKELRLLLSQKDTILYNDMVSRISYDKDKYKMLKHISIPFLWAAGRFEDGWLETELSRSTVRMMPKLMEKIAEKLYDRELSAIGTQLERLKADPKYNDKRKLAAYLTGNSKLFREYEFILLGDKFLLNQNYMWVSRICSNSDSFEEIKQAQRKRNEKWIFQETILDKSRLADYIEDGAAGCLSFRYLKDYLLDASKPKNRANRLRRKAVFELLEFLLEASLLDDYGKCEGPDDCWKWINQHEDTIQKRIAEKSEHGILAIKGSTKDFQGDYMDTYFIKLKEFVSPMDDSFIKLMDARLKDKTEQGDIWRHYFTLA